MVVIVVEVVEQNCHCHLQDGDVDVDALAVVVVVVAAAAGADDVGDERMSSRLRLPRQQWRQPQRLGWERRIA